MNQNTLDKLIKKSQELVYLVPNNQHKHFSFILRRNKVLSFGWNVPFKTHTFALKWQKEYIFLHSELHAIKNFGEPPIQLEGLTMVNTRIGKSGLPRLSKPCECCQRALLSFGIESVFFTNNHGGFEQL